MSAKTNSQREPLESELLVRFESDNIPEDYKEYYKTKRQNFFASIQRFAPIWKYYHLLDTIWLREFGDLKPPGNASQLIPLMLYINAHAKTRVSIELALSGCLPEARSILRDAVECGAHAHQMIRDPQLQKVWVRKSDEEQAFRQAFERHKKDNLFKGLDELHRTWSQLSETGSHTTMMSMCDRCQIETHEDGNQTWALTYSGAEERHWATSLFSMLLTCFTIERTFYEDYESRLRLDHVLISMRAEFEVYKEQLRAKLIQRYQIEMPVPQATILTV